MLSRAGFSITTTFAATAIQSVAAGPGAYDWEGDMPLNRPSSRTIVQEAQVREAGAELPERGLRLHAIPNAYWKSLDFEMRRKFKWQPEQ